MTARSLAAFDDRPFFDKALRLAARQGLLPPDRLDSLQGEFAKGIVQIANYFGTAYLRPDLELATRRMVNLMSLFLEDQFDGDLQAASAALRERTLLSLSKSGSDMLKRLNALPDTTLVLALPVTPESQRAYLDAMTAADTIALDEYRAELAAREANRNVIEFAYWLGKRMGVGRDDIDDAESLIRSAMLVLFVGDAELRMPTRTEFVALVKAARSAKCRLDDRRLERLLREAPSEFQRLGHAAMTQFVEDDLPRIRKSGVTADKLLYGQTGATFFVRESLDEDAREYERLVAREWDRVTHGEADDPAVVATVCLFVATGLPPKASMLLREARDVVGRFRGGDWQPAAVPKFIEEHAPESLREDLLRFWADDLKPDAEQHLADTDPNWPDSHMDRALDYLRKTCAARWKGRKR